MKKKPESRTTTGWALCSRTAKGCIWFHAPPTLYIDKDNARMAGRAAGWKIARVKIIVRLKGPLYDASNGRRER